ncbi:MAG: hypothetical protein SYNGOMJ08_00273 [Candidatus Syntrophoarchaeum sp. GoM_oil]|nr:MAG: hypothetical protein SYNGOMJ08_00273 [Candidatus Syntrophoarchaeum sp. GoM_oil]
MELNKSELGSEYLKFCELRSDALHTNELDLSKMNWFYPTSLLPLGIFMKERPDISVIPPSNPNVSAYVDIITKSEMSPLSQKSYIPIVQVPLDKNQRDKMLEPLYCKHQQFGGINAFGYFVGELVDNIYQHSNFSTAYIMAQEYSQKRFIDVGIIDNGVSIPGAFEKAGFNVDDDAKALAEAVKGLSTKKDEGERGYGLRSNIKLLTEGLNGRCFNRVKKVVS